MKIHDIKCLETWFNLAKTGYKTCEVRRNDRDYQSGDLLVLREWIKKTGQYTGEFIIGIITHVLNDADFTEGLQPGYCVLSYKMLGNCDGEKWAVYR